MPTRQQHCFHCDLIIDANVDIRVPVLGSEQSMCCEGCAAVARAIVDANLESYYSYRTESSKQGEQLIPEQLRELKLYDHPKIQQSFVHASDDNIREASLILEGITCAACVWLNQQHLSKLDGIQKVEINYTTLKALVVWDARKINLSNILEAIQHIGYTAHPYDPNERHALIEKSRKDTLKRLGAAGGFGMQVMALAFSLYLDDGSMNNGIKHLIERASLILTLPVIFYSAKPFFSGALNDLKNLRFGMDTPVAVGMGLAFTASVFSLITGRGEIYFDSVCMFTFLLLGARYLEISARKQAADNADIVTQNKPVIARKLTSDGSTKMTPAIELNVGDEVLVLAGDTLPADGIIVAGQSNLDESIISGESKPQFKSVTNQVIGGSINIDSPITIKVKQVGTHTVLAGIQRLLDEAQTTRPLITQLADKIAGWFVVIILSLASITGLIWYGRAPDMWLDPTIAVLIVSCPCALSLATPASITTAIGNLMRNGIVISNKNALVNLSKLSIMFFDKTGTLTQGKLHIAQYHVIDSAYDNSHFDICNAIERHSEHPIAAAFAKNASSLIAHDVQNSPGKGLTGTIDKTTYYLGTAAFIKTKTGKALDTKTQAVTAQNTQVLLANKKGIIALYGLEDAIRPHSRALIQALNSKGIETVMVTGDNERVANRVARRLGIKKVFANQLPADKLALIKQYQQAKDETSIVGMVGDGINDAAVLAGADCSFSMQGAATLASVNSDVLLLTPDIFSVQTAIKVANNTHSVIKQNLFWAFSYNILAIPAAAMGFVPPWLAALGMSLSSLLVVLNALRLKR